MEKIDFYFLLNIDQIYTCIIIHLLNTFIKYINYKMNIPIDTTRLHEHIRRKENSKYITPHIIKMNYYFTWSFNREIKNIALSRRDITLKIGTYSDNTISDNKFNLINAEFTNIINTIREYYFCYFNIDLAKLDYYLQKTKKMYELLLDYSNKLNNIYNSTEFTNITVYIYKCELFSLLLEINENMSLILNMQKYNKIILLDSEKNNISAVKNIIYDCLEKIFDTRIFVDANYLFNLVENIQECNSQELIKYLILFDKYIEDKQLDAFTMNTNFYDKYENGGKYGSSIIIFANFIIDNDYILSRSDNILDICLTILRDNKNKINNLIKKCETLSTTNTNLNLLIDKLTLVPPDSASLEYIAAANNFSKNKFEKN